MKRLRIKLTRQLKSLDLKEGELGSSEGVETKIQELLKECPDLLDQTKMKISSSTLSDLRSLKGYLKSDIPSKFSESLFKLIYYCLGMFFFKKNIFPYIYIYIYIYIYLYLICDYMSSLYCQHTYKHYNTTFLLLTSSLFVFFLKMYK